MARHFANWLEAYLEYNEVTEAPYNMHLWTGVGTIAGALRRRVWCHQLHYQWVPNFYIILVAPPGVATKSTTIRTGINLLKQVRNIHFGPSSLTWQYMTQALEEAQESILLNPDEEDLLQQKRMTHASITCAITELGTFLNVEDTKFLDVFTALWDGQVEDWTHGTKKDGEKRVSNPWVNILAATTPDWIRRNLPESLLYGGLMSRCVLIYADKKRRLIAYPAQEKRRDDHERLEQLLVDDLQSISEMQGEYKLTPEAMEYGTYWYRELHEKVPSHLTGDRLLGYLSRKQGHVHKLAMVTAAAQRGELYITLDDLQAAITSMDLTEADMLKVLQTVGSTVDAKDMQYILTLLKAVSQLEERTLWKMCHNLMPWKRFEQALADAAKAGYVVLHMGHAKAYAITPEGRMFGEIKPSKEVLQHYVTPS